MIKLNQLYVIETPKGKIQEEGIKEILAMLSAIGQKVDPFRSGVEDVWQTAGGNLPKRIASWLWKEHNFKLPIEIVANIGAIARRNCALRPRYFDFVDRLTWAPGTFGDEGSCYFTSRRQTWEDLMASGALVMRHFLPGEGPFYDGKYIGEGRCIVYPVKRDEVLAVSNAYSPSIGLLVFARSLALLLGATYQQISTKDASWRFYWAHNEQACPEVYINNQSLILVGSPAAVLPDKVEMPIKRCLHRHNPICDQCKAEHFLADSRHCNYRTLCPDCWTTCATCGEATDKTQILTIKSKKICETCRDIHYAYCNNCKQWGPKDHVWGEVCSTCVSSEYVLKQVSNAAYHYLTAPNIVRLVNHYLSPTPIMAGVAAERMTAQ